MRMERSSIAEDRERPGLGSTPQRLKSVVRPAQAGQLLSPDFYPNEGPAKRSRLGADPLEDQHRLVVVRFGTRAEGVGGMEQRGADAGGILGRHPVHELE
jgi:hypothetical protein